jgi:cysteine desulfurase
MKLPIYLDNNSTTEPDRRVLDKLIDAELKFYGNSSSNHFHGWQSQEVIKIAREQIATAVNSEPDNIIFTSGASEANSLVIKGYLQKQFLKKITFATSKIEHSSILANFENLSAQGADTFYFKNNKNGSVNLENISGHVFASLHLANNEIGTIQAVENLCAYFKDSFLHSDSCQALGKLPIDIKKLKINCLTISSHKIHGPKGIGALIFDNQTSMSKINSQILGGEHQYNLRSGTLPTGLIAAFGEAVKISNEELEKTRKNLEKLSTVFIKNLSLHFDRFSILGNQKIENRLPGNLSLCLNSVNADILLTKLSSKISFSTGSACQQNTTKKSHVLNSLDLNENEQKNVIRIGIGKMNSEEEIKYASELIGKTAKELSRN